MSYSGDAAEQVVRIYLDGVQVAAKLTGKGAERLAVLPRLELKAVMLLKRPRRVEPKPTQSVPVLRDALDRADFGAQVAEGFRVDGGVGGW